MDVEAKIGEVFDLSVEQLGSAGYEWHVEPLPAGIELIGTHASPPPRGAPPGTAGRKVFSFRSDEPGPFEIVLISKRRWEREPAERRVFRVVLK